MWTSLGIKFYPQQTILNSWIKFAKKVISGLNRKSEIHHWILHIRISLGTRFHPKLTILIFWTKFAPKSYFWSKTKKSEHYHGILHVQISPGTKSYFKQFWILEPNFLKNEISGRKQKKINITIDFWIFELALVANLRILIFWTKFAQKWSKNINRTFACIHGPDVLY